MIAAAFLFALSLVFFYPDLFLVKAAFLAGDHWEQHYPWAYWLAESIKQFQFPWWTDLIHSGFPITAEGQIGSFYLPNLALYFLLPIKWAYSYSSLVHFWLSGFATFLYARTIRLSWTSSFLAGFIFLYGSAFGGAYYNITSLKTFAWMPFCLFAFEQFYATRRKRCIVIFSVGMAMALLAGYLQMATLMWLIVGIYVFLRIFLITELKQASEKLRMSATIITAVLVAILLSLPQLLLTFQLAIQSNRLNLSEHYAYIGSLSPGSLLSLIFTEMQGLFRGNSLYSSVLAIFLTLFSCFSADSRKSIGFKLWFWMGLIGLLIALGRWSPLYVMIIKLTHFYSFRIPAKFLILICFSLAMLSAIGFETLKNELEKQQFATLKRVSKIYTGIIVFSILIYAFFYLLLTWLRPPSEQISEQYIKRFIYGQTGHPHSMEIYQAKLQASLNSAKQMLSFENPWNIWNFALIALSFMVLYFLNKKNSRFTLILVLMLITLDLYGFSWRDIRLDFGCYKRLEHPSRVVELLNEAKTQGELGRIYQFRTQEETIPLPPSANMLYGIEDIGAYSPFVLARYHETIGQFGNVNDSNFAYAPSEPFVREHVQMLHFLKVTHIISTRPLEIPGFNLLRAIETEGLFVFQTDKQPVEAHFITEVEFAMDWTALKNAFMKPGFDPKKKLMLEQSDNNFPSAPPAQAEIKLTEKTSHFNHWHVKTSGAGFFVVPKIAYPEWQATVNGKEAPILKGDGLFQTIRIEQAGEYDIQFRYVPYKWLNRSKN